MAIAEEASPRQTKRDVMGIAGAGVEALSESYV
jgi:hypothetical protein